jgi:threonine/homoserine efflux transporter RhtA
MGVGLGVAVGLGVGVGHAVGVGVGVGVTKVGSVIVLPIKVTADCANALPYKVAPSCIAIPVWSSMLP